MRLRASLHCVFSTLMCFLNERCESHHSPRNFVDSSTGKSVFPILTMGGLWARDRGAVKCMTLHLWAANLKPFLVAHSCMAFTACCRCLSMVSRERPRKHIARSSTKSAVGNELFWGNLAEKSTAMLLAIRIWVVFGKLGRLLCSDAADLRDQWHILRLKRADGYTSDELRVTR